MTGIECYDVVERHQDLTVFVKTHAALIYKMAWQIKNRLAAQIELDDLIQSGLIGLLEAKNTYSEAAGASFITYASLKVRCAIYEFVRKHSGITRDISQNIKKISETMAKVEHQHQGHITDKIVADEMGVSLKKYADMTREINAYRAISMQEPELREEFACEATLDPLAQVEEECDKSVIKAIISALPQREQTILGLYYNNQLSFKEIAVMMNLTEARISQIHSTLLDKLKRQLTRQFESQV